MTGALSIAVNVVFTGLYATAFGVHYVIANLLAIGTGSLLTFIANDRSCFAPARRRPASLPRGRRERARVMEKRFSNGRRDMTTGSGEMTGAGNSKKRTRQAPRRSAMLQGGLAVVLAAAGTAGLDAAELHDETIAAWQRYVEATEQRIAGELEAGGRFLVQDFGDDAAGARRDVLAGDVRIDRMETRDAAGERIEVPKGAIHHWRGSVLIPGVALDDVLHGLMHGTNLTKMQNGVVESRVLDRDGDRLHVFLKLRRKQLITVHLQHRASRAVHAPPPRRGVEPQCLDPDRRAGRRRIAGRAREADRARPGVHVASELLLALSADRRRRHRRMRVGEPEPRHSARHTLDGGPHREPDRTTGDDPDVDVDGRDDERPGAGRDRVGTPARQSPLTGGRESGWKIAGRNRRRRRRRNPKTTDNRRRQGRWERDDALEAPGRERPAGPRCPGGRDPGRNRDRRRAAELQPQTVAAWERYVEATERRIADELDDPERFLVLDFRGDTAPARREILSDQVRIDKLETRAADGERIRVPKGTIHHWLGSALIPDVMLEEVLHALIYAVEPEALQDDVIESRVLGRPGDDRLELFLKLRREQVVTVHFNTEHSAAYTRHRPGMASSRTIATRIAELDGAGTPDEREKPVGRDRGFLWRLNTYWRYEQVDEGVIFEIESLSLSRGIPPSCDGWCRR